MIKKQEQRHIYYDRDLGIEAYQLSGIVQKGLDNIIMRLVDIFTCIPSMLMTLAMNLLGDGLRDALDPRSKR
ncbi:hypothetical protein [Eubacterium sp. am_0171]|uniref:hypothetical protein n=1 Tax=unclassified Eubacterium (in: firmicutes) TaxID=2624479 RepID=UPI0026AFE179